MNNSLLFTIIILFISSCKNEVKMNSENNSTIKVNKIYFKEEVDFDSDVKTIYEKWFKLSITKEIFKASDTLMPFKYQYIWIDFFCDKTYQNFDKEFYLTIKNDSILNKIKQSDIDYFKVKSCNDSMFKIDIKSKYFEFKGDLIKNKMIKTKVFDPDGPSSSKSSDE